MHTTRIVRVILLTFATLAASACSHASMVASPDATPSRAVDAQPTVDASDAMPGCQQVTDTAPVVVGAATTADDYALVLTAASASQTSWGSAGNEALVLEVSSAQRGFIGHLVLHQGATPFDYGMHLGALAANDSLAVRVSPLSAVTAVRAACVTAKLTPASALGAAGEGLVHAPIYRWPAVKAFDDVPLITGWSKSKQGYQGVMTNEDGGTAEICGGGASGMQAEFARWGRGADIELHYSYGGAAPKWERCTGTVAVTTTALGMEGAHPQLYYGDGHNRLFESRGGYGQTCGGDLPDKPTGDIVGWSTQNPGNDLAHDAGLVIVLRPLPYDMDALGYAATGGRREGIADHYAPWLYRLTALELAKEGKIDNAKTFGLSRYLYADVKIADVGGSGDQYCSTLGVSGGFVLRAITKAGATINGPQITADYASSGALDWKRVAIPLPDGVGATDIDHFRFDAYDDDGIYLLGIGDAFVATAAGDNNATLEYVRQGETALAYYVDDDSSSCSGGVNTGGPGGVAVPCAGSFVDIPN